MTEFILSPLGEIDFIGHALTAMGFPELYIEDVELFDYDTVTFTKVELINQMAIFQDEYNGLEYARLRKVAYDLLNQYELLFDDKVNGTTILSDTIATIKATYPKPGA